MIEIEFDRDTDFDTDREHKSMSKTILVADDAESVREIICNTLSIFGYSMVEARDGVMALEKLQSENFDLLITDVDMPGMTGLELIRRMRKEQNLAKLPVIVITAEDRDIRAEVREIASAVMRKPFSPAELLELVASIFKS